MKIPQPYKKISVVISLLCFSIFNLSFSEDGSVQKYSNKHACSFPGYDSANRISYSRSENVCVRRKADTGEMEFVFLKGKKEIYKWPTIGYLGDTDDFEILRTNLEGPGSNEIVTANIENKTVGIEVKTWTISIFEEPIGYKEPVSFKEEDYGPSSFHMGNDGTCSILSTEWIGGIRNTKHKDSMYFSGRWFKYKNGMLKPDLEKPILMRRYTSSFESIRAHCDDNYPVYEWLTDKVAISANEEPKYLGDDRKVTSRKGFITKAERVVEEGDINLYVHVRFDDSTEEVLKYFSWNNEDKSPTEKFFNRFGDEASGRLYPNFYVPSDPALALKGKKVIVKTYPDKPIIASHVPNQILWFEN